MDKLNTHSNDVYHDFIKKASFPFFIIKKNGIIQETNSFTEKLCGETLGGKKFKDIIVDFHNLVDLSEMVKNTDNTYLLNIQGQNGLPQTYHFTFLLLDNKIYAFGQQNHDELETVQRKMVSLNTKLNNLTRELHKKNAQLKQLNDEKNKFLGMAAHDLRKPIGLVLTYSEFLLEEAGSDLNSEQIGFFNTIKTSCVFMKRLVDDFLDVSAIEAGKFELDLQPASIYEVLEQTLNLNKHQAKKKGIELQVEQDENIPRVTIDAPKIEQAMANLVSNAIEHTPADSNVVIRIRRNEGTVTFSVQDSGPGIPTEEKEKLFKPFEKTRAKKTAGEKSTGLGLVITRKIIEAHAGKIWFESELNKGATIFFQLPIQRKEQ
jgi:signal transduction histidine kinase